MFLIAENNELPDLFSHSTFVFLPDVIWQRRRLLSRRRIDNPPRIDGILDDEVWERAHVVSRFRSTIPQGRSSSNRISMTALYIGFRAYDTRPGKNCLHHFGTKKRFLIWFKTISSAFAIDSYNDERNGYWFSTNPLGARGVLNSETKDLGTKLEWNLGMQNSNR